MAGDALLDAFINANILFIIGYGLWLAVRTAMQFAGWKYAFATQLRLLHAVFLAILCAPFVAIGFRRLQETGFAQGVNFNLSDIVVSYYLNGGLEMKASEFEALVLARDSFMFNVMHADGLFAQGVIAIFLIGLAIGASRLLLSVACLWQIVSASYSWRNIGRLRILLSDRILVPFSTRGIFNYYIVIPSHMLSSNEALKVAIAHEIQHIRQGDLEWEVALEILKPFFFLNPAFRAWKHQVERLRELNCDTEVLSLGRIHAREYCDTLLSICQKTLRRDRAFVIAVPKVTLVTADRETIFPARQSFLEKRIVSALDGRRPRHQHLLFAAIAVPLLAVMTLTILAIQSPGDWSHDRLMLSTVVNLDRLDEINRLSTFGRIRD